MRLRAWLSNALSACPFACPAVAVACTVAAVDSACVWWWLVVVLAVCFASLSRPMVWLLAIVVSLAAGMRHDSQLKQQAVFSECADDWWEGEVNVVGEPLNGSVELEICSGEHTGQRLRGMLPRESEMQLLHGEKLSVEGRFLAPERALNPDAFPEDEWLHRQGIALKFLVRHCEQKGADVGVDNVVVRWAVRARQWARGRLLSGDDPLRSSVVCAMVLGERPRDAQSVVDVFRQSGTIHVFAVSGLHVMMVGTIVAVGLRFLGAPRWLWVFLVVSSMFFYALVTGMRPPAMRAALMGMVLLSAWLVGRRLVLANSVALCAVVALLWDGHLLFLTGFQLSFVVLIAIIALGAVMEKLWAWITYVDPFIPFSLYGKRRRVGLFFRRKVQGAVVVGSCAWCGASPLTWLNFGLLAPLSIAVSIPMVALLYGVLVSSIIALTLGAAWSPLGDKANALPYWMAGKAVQVAELGAKVHVAEAEWSQGERVVVYALPEGEAAVYFGIGGGTLLDTGSESGFKYQVLPSLRKKGARLDSVIVSHADAEHMGGLELVCAHFRLRQSLMPVGESVADCKTVRARQGQLLELSKSARLEVVHAVQHQDGVADDRCMVLRLHWSGVKVLFTNDAGFRFEQKALVAQQELSADVLLLGNHESDLSAGLDFITHVNPSVVILQQKALPSEEWKRQLEAQGRRVLMLEYVGALTLVPTAQGVLLEGELSGVSIPITGK